MRDVAEAAGVSTALVSIVFRGVAGASEETRARVFAEAERIGYRANRTASLMKLRRTKHLGVTFSAGSAFHAALVENIQEAATEAGYEVVLSLVSRSHDEERAVDALLGFRCEGVVLLGCQLPTAKLAALATEVPLVLVGRSGDVEGVAAVRSADKRGVALAVDHLAKLGHRDIVHVDGGPQPVSAQRRRGYRTAMRRRGLGEFVRVTTGGDRERDGRRAAEELLRGGAPPTAVVAFNDHCALGVQDAFSRAGLRVPEDCSVTGYDNSTFAALNAIDLTTVDQEPAALARAAVRVAVDRLEGRSADADDLVLEPRLVVRGSTAPPRTEDRG